MGEYSNNENYLNDDTEKLDTREVHRQIKKQNQSGLFKKRYFYYICLVLAIAFYVKFLK